MIAITLASSSGCTATAFLQDWQFSHSNKRRASCAWTKHFTWEARKSLSVDFEEGYKQGYYDTAMGKDCRLPPVAPPKYWSAKYQTCSGQVATEHWFTGYQTGIDHAQADGRYSSAAVPVSPTAPVLNSSSCKACYSPSPCSCGIDPVLPYGSMGSSYGEFGESFELPAASIPVPVTTIPLTRFSPIPEIAEREFHEEFSYEMVPPFESVPVYDDITPSTRQPTPDVVPTQGTIQREGGLIGGYGIGIQEPN